MSSPIIGATVGVKTRIDGSGLPLALPCTRVYNPNPTLPETANSLILVYPIRQVIAPRSRFADEYELHVGVAYLKKLTFSGGQADLNEGDELMDNVNALIDKLRGQNVGTDPVYQFREITNPTAFDDRAITEENLFLATLVCKYFIVLTRT